MPEEDVMDDDFSAGEEGAAASGAKRGLLGFIPPVVISILKWVFIILVLVGTMILVSFVVNRVMNKNSQSSLMLLGGVVSPNTPVKPPKYSSFGLDDIRARTVDTTPAMVIVGVTICFDIGDDVTMTELIDRKNQLEDSIRHYFTTKRKAELYNEELIKRELTARLNQIMTTERVRDVLFKTFDIIDQ